MSKQRQYELGVALRRAYRLADDAATFLGPGTEDVLFLIAQKFENLLKQEKNRDGRNANA